MRFFSKDLNPLKIQTRFKLEFSSEFYNSKFRQNFDLGQRGKSFHLNWFTTMTSLENFRLQEEGVLYFLKIDLVEPFGKLWNKEKGFNSPARLPCTGPSPPGPPAIFPSNTHAPSTQADRAVVALSLLDCRTHGTDRCRPWLRRPHMPRDLSPHCCIEEKKISFAIASASVFLISAPLPCYTVLCAIDDRRLKPPRPPLLVHLGAR
jgi:hypothetical protein